MAYSRAKMFSWTLAAVILGLLGHTTVHAWDAYAGLVRPLGWGTRTVTVSTNDVADKANILDGNENTQWQSGACFPTGFIARPEMNALLNACNATTSSCSFSTGSKSLSSAFDNSFYTGATIALSGSSAFVTVTLSQPRDIYRLYFRGNYGNGVAKLILTYADGSTTTITDALNSTLAWKDQMYRGLWSNVVKFTMTSNASFTLTELAAQYERCFEQATVDMQQSYPVYQLRVRWWSTAALNTSLLTSEDGVTWNTIRDDLVSATLPTTDFWLEDPIQVRYIRIKHLVKEENWMKVYAWEIQAYGKGGRWGMPPAPAQQTSTFRQLLGVNGIWGFGNGSFSDTLAKQGLGPKLYNSVASSGRNYQNLNWDVKALGNDPKWATMNKTGTGGQWWLDWHREYRAWRDNGLPVAVTYQFTAKDAISAPAAWKDAYATAYDLGYKFARNFGKTYGAGTAESFEAGNEPWDYNATFYTQILRGFVSGLYDGDSTVKRLPCALQAYDQSAEGPSGGHFLGARVPEDLAPKIDALNTHMYSYFRVENGTRIAVHPEHPGSSMNGLHNFMAWRDANMPGTPVWVTEWGWDANRPGEPCGSTTTECVSQTAQAAYGLRGLAMLARKGVSQTHWFFYANDDKCNTLYCRSGLRDTYTNRFAELPVYRSFKAFMQLAGSSYFRSVAAESTQVFAYAFSNKAGTPTHVLAWRPVPVGATEAEALADSTTVQFDVGFSAAATEAWMMSGAVVSGKIAAGLPAISGSSWSMSISGIPTLVVLAAQ